MKKFLTIIINGIDLSDLILIFLSFNIRTFMMVLFQLNTGMGKKKLLCKQNLWLVLLIFNITCLKNKFWNCLSFTKSLDLIQIIKPLYYYKWTSPSERVQIPTLTRNVSSIALNYHNLRKFGFLTVEREHSIK